LITRALIVLSFLVRIGLLRAETVYLYPSADTSIVQAFPANNFGGNEFFNSGTTQNYTTNRGLLKFEVATALPRNAKIIAATLTVEVVGTPVDGDMPSSFGLHRMLFDWGEGDKAGHPPEQPFLGDPATIGEATFLDRAAFTTNAWHAPGGATGVDYVTEFSSDTFVYGINFSPYTFESTPRLVSDVQQWLQGPNFGWMFISQVETNNFTARRFASREDPYRAPLLVIDYFVPQIDHVVVQNGVAAVTFMVHPGFVYRLRSCSGLSGTPWETVTNIPAQVTAVPVTINDPVTTAARLYTLVVE
jgi:hypothetical protein